MKIEIRSDSVEISGYVNAVGRESRPMRGSDGKYFTEIIQPGVFARALMRGKRSMLLNHNPDRVLGTEGDNLQLKEDAVGLFAKATVTDFEVIEKARNGELRGWSFGFVPVKQHNAENDGMTLRTLDEIELHEVSIIDTNMMPAYSATSVFTRANDEVETRTMDMQDVEVSEEKPPQIDYEPYFERIRSLKLD